MKVWELMHELTNMDPDHEVIVQKEGGAMNGYSPAVAIEPTAYVPENTFSGECYSLDDEDRPVKAAVGNAVVIKPIR